MKLKMYLVPLLLVVVSALWCNGTPDIMHHQNNIYALFQHLTLLIWLCAVGLFIFGWFTARTDDLVTFTRNKKFLIFITNAFLFLIVFSAPYTLYARLIFLGIFLCVESSLCLMIRTQYPRDQYVLWPWFHYVYNCIALACALAWLYGKIDVGYIVLGIGTLIFLFYILKDIVIHVFEAVAAFLYRIF